METFGPRERVVDDTDPALQYSGWLVADPATLTGGNEGPIYLDTSHVAVSDSTVTFPFNGTSIRALGTIMASTADNVTHPAWDCFVDQIRIGNYPNIQFAENNLQLCSQPEVASGSHNFTIEVHSTGGGALYLDHLKYTPPPDENFANAVLSYSNTDPSGSQVTLDFEGTSVILYGLVPARDYAHNATWATYAIDGSSPVNFTLSGLPPQTTTTQYNAILFTTPTISGGPHKLVVTYGGDSGYTPLTVGEFFVTNTTSIDTDSAGSSSSALPLPSKSPALIASSKKVPAGVIAGSIVGAVMAVVLLALAIYYQRRRRARSADQTSTNPYPMSITDRESLGGAVFSPTRRYLSMKLARENATPVGVGRPTRNADNRPDVLVVRYADSGVRLSPSEDQIVEVPPGYSAS
ncbi:hypothetical protein DFH06DRAFT_1333876 [Mycena polygramma]|nr:hypothetical protein DFH06DRAFT_1333876 [Mycena polygramma]